MIMPASKTLSAYKDIDTDSAAKSVAVSTHPLLNYLANLGYKWNRRMEGDVVIEEYEGPNCRIILKHIPEPNAEELKGVRHKWEFDCPPDEADMHIRNLKQFYERIDFEIDE